MKKRLMILMLLLTNCKTIIFDCPEIVNYTVEEQHEIAVILKQQNNKTLNRFFIDYYNLRNSVIRELQTNQLINYSEMVSRLLDNYNPAGVDVNVTELKDKLLLQSKGKFDTQFHTNPDAIKKNKKIVLRVSPSIDIVVKEGLYDWESNFKICKKSDGASYLMVRCDESEILKSFSVDE